MTNNINEPLYKTLESIQNQIRELREELQTIRNQNLYLKMENDRLRRKQETFNYLNWTVLKKVFYNIDPLEKEFIEDKNQYLQWVRNYNYIFQFYKKPQKYINLQVLNSPCILSHQIIYFMKNKHFQCLTSYQIQKMLKIDRFKTRRVIDQIIKKNTDFVAISMPHYVPNKNHVLKVRGVVTL